MGKHLQENNVKTLNGESLVGTGDIVITGGGSSAAVDITYSNTLSGMTATDVQAAIDEIESRVGILEGAGPALGDDDIIIFDSALSTMDATEFPDTTNIDISGETLLATADSASATSYVVSQDVVDGDFVNARPTTVNTPVLYGIESATNTEVTVSPGINPYSLIDGDTVLINDGADTNLISFDTTGKITVADGSLNTNTTDAVPTMTSATTPSGYRISASSALAGGYDAFNAFADDGSTSSWVTNNTPTGWIQVEFDTPIVSNKITVTSSDSKNITSYKVLASNTGAFGGEEVTLLSETATIGITTATLTFTNSTDYSFYRFQILSSSSTNYVIVREIEIIETDVNYTLDLTSVSLSNAPTIVARDTASISTSIVASGAGASFVERTKVSNTADAEPVPSKITTVFDTDTRNGRDFQVKVDLPKAGDEVTRIEVDLDKVG